MRKLIDIPGNAPETAGLLESGIYPSLAAKQQKLWLQASNVDFYDRSVEKGSGFTRLSEVTGTVSGLAQAYVEGERRAYLGTNTSLYLYNEGDTTPLRTTYTGGRWSLLPWGSWLLAVNGVDNNQIWKNTGSAADWAGIPTAAQAARIVRKLAERPILFKGQTAWWPRTTDIEYWTVPDPEGRAGTYPIRDLDSDIIAVEPLGELLAFYTKNKMGLVSFIGGQTVYGFKTRLTGIGAVGINAVIPVGQTHYGMSINGFWMTDGSGHRYIDHPAVNRFVDTHFDKTRGDDVVGFHVNDKHLLEWHFPGPDAHWHGLSYNYVNGAWGHVHKGIKSAVPQEVFDYPLVGRDGEWGTYDNSTDLGSSVLTSSLISGGFDAGEAQRYKWWDKVEVNIESVGSVEVRFGLHTRETYGDTAEDRYTDWMPLTRENWVQQESVYLTMELRSQGINTSWRIGGLSVWGEIGGHVSA